GPEDAQLREGVGAAMERLRHRPPAEDDNPGMRGRRAARKDTSAAENRSRETRRRGQATSSPPSRIHSGEAAAGGEGERGGVGRPGARRRAGFSQARGRKGGVGGKRGAAFPPTHYVPKSRSPKSPRPGRMYLRSLRARSRAAVKITASGTTAARWA